MKIAYTVPAFPNFINQFQFNEIKFFAKNHDIHILTIIPWGGKAWNDESKKLRKSKLFSKNFQIFIFILKIVNNFFKSKLNLKAKYFAEIKLSLKDKVKLKYLESLICVYSDYINILEIEHIHSDFATSSGLVAMEVAILNKINYSVKLHAHDIYRNDLEIKHPYIKQVLKKAKVIFAEHEYGKKQLIKNYSWINNSKIIVNRTGIDLEYFNSNHVKIYNENNKINLICIGRLDEKKGQKYLIDACAELKKNEIDFDCQIIGYGPLKDDLIAQIKYLELENEIKLLGKLSPSEVVNYLKQSDIYILPCTTNLKTGDMDGIPTSILESMSVGVPVITTPISGIPEAIENNKTGILVDPNNSMQIYAGIVQLANNHKLRNEIVKNARKKISEDFDYLKNSKELLENITKQ